MRMCKNIVDPNILDNIDERGLRDGESKNKRCNAYQSIYNEFYCMAMSAIIGPVS
ncbi:MAG: hypothetical protein IPH42_21625 [Bacteroidetes bacterium]|nr:hypothetical protein [Bacteroidota bacterium]